MMVAKEEFHIICQAQFAITLMTVEISYKTVGFIQRVSNNFYSGTCTRKPHMDIDKEPLITMSQMINNKS